MVVAIGVLLVIQMMILGLNLHGVYRIVTMALFPVLFVAGMILLISSVAVLIVVLLFVFIFQVLFASKKADAAVANRCCKTAITMLPHKERASTQETIMLIRKGNSTYRILTKHVLKYRMRKFFSCGAFCIDTVRLFVKRVNL